MLGLRPVAAVAGTLIVAVCASTASAAVVLQAPASGATVNGDIHLVLRAPTLIPLWVRLNGRAVTLPPPLRNGRMELWLSPAEGLRRGGNTLAVGLGADSRPVVRRRFRLTTRLPLAAGADVITAPGAPVTLDAGAVKDAAGGPLRYRWRLVSGARGLGLPRSGSGRRLVLDPRALGRAVYSLRVTEASSRRAVPVSSPLQYVTATVGPASPLETIDTDADVLVGPFRFHGIRVGNSVYQAPAPPEGGRSPALQVVALDRTTLALIRNFTIGCDAADAACGTSISDKLKGLGNALVIASVHSPNTFGPLRGHYLISTATLAGLKAIGGPANPTPGTDGTFAAIGVPGMAAGSGWSAGGPGPGRLTGYATQDTWGNWTYTAGDPVAFDTNPGSGPNESSISIGDHTYTLRKHYSELDDGCSSWSKIPSPAPAAQLLVVNRFTLAPVLNRVYAVNSVCSIDAMVRALNAVTSDQIALLNDSDGVRTTSTFFFDQGAPWFAARERLAVAVERLGGVRDTITRLEANSGEPSPTPYSLVGRPGLKPGQGLEASPVLSNSEETGRVAGTLSRDQSNRYAADTANFVTGPQNQVTNVLYQPLQQWPLLDTEAHKKALAWVEDKADGGGNLRTDYWQQGWSDAVWNNKDANIRALTFPGPGHGFEETDLADVKDELAKEIGWLISVRSYFGRLGAPYTDGALASQAELQKIAGRVQDGVQPPPDAQAGLPWLTFAAEVGAVVATSAGYSPWGEAARGLATIVSALKAGIALARATSGKPVSEADYRAKVADLGVTLADNIQRSKDALKRMQSIIVGDFGKLKTLGSLGDCSQTSLRCPKEWQLTPSTESFARSLLILQAKRSFYAALLPLKFEGDILHPSLGLDPNARRWSCEKRGLVGQPFFGEPDSGFVQLRYLSPTLNPATRWETLALRVRGTNPKLNNQFPKASLLDPLFAPVDLANPTGDNLGLIKTQFYLQTWGRYYPDFGCSIPRK